MTNHNMYRIVAGTTLGEVLLALAGCAPGLPPKPTPEPTAGKPVVCVDGESARGGAGVIETAENIATIHGLRVDTRTLTNEGKELSAELSGMFPAGAILSLTVDKDGQVVDMNVGPCDQEYPDVPELPLATPPPTR